MLQPAQWQETDLLFFGEYHALSGAARVSAHALRLFPSCTTIALSSFLRIAIARRAMMRQHIHLPPLPPPDRSTRLQAITVSKANTRAKKKKGAAPVPFTPAQNLQFTFHSGNGGGGGGGRARNNGTNNQPVPFVFGSPGGSSRGVSRRSSPRFLPAGQAKQPSSFLSPAFTFNSIPPPAAFNNGLRNGGGGGSGGGMAFPNSTFSSRTARVVTAGRGGGGNRRAAPKDVKPVQANAANRVVSERTMCGLETWGHA